MQDIRELIESFSRWVLMGIGFTIGSFLGSLIFLFSSDTFSFLESYRLQFLILGAGIGGAQGFTLVKWMVMRCNQKVWQRLDWTENAIEIPSVICDLSIILSCAAAGTFLLQLLLNETIESDTTFLGEIGATIGVVIALGVIFSPKIKKRFLTKNEVSNRNG